MAISASTDHLQPDEPSAFKLSSDHKSCKHVYIVSKPSIHVPLPKALLTHNEHCVLLINAAFGIDTDQRKIFERTCWMSSTAHDLIDVHPLRPFHFSSTTFLPLQPIGPNTWGCRMPQYTQHSWWSLPSISIIVRNENLRHFEPIHA